MSIEQLKTDWDALEKRVNSMNPALTTNPEIVRLIKDELAPFMKCMVDEMGEQDGALADLFNDAEDILQPETAGLFAVLITTGRELLAKLEAVSKKAGDLTTLAEIKAWREISKTAEEALEEITVPDDGDAEEADDDAEDIQDDGKEPK